MLVLSVCLLHVLLQADAISSSALILLQIPATSEKHEKDTVLMYGHLDKQPPMTTGWAEGTGPYTPVIKDGKVISLPFLFFFWFY